ncbi:MAG: hypothetical protein ACI85K_000781, partial [Hyphomicrobiaceae bacterium]
ANSTVLFELTVNDGVNSSSVDSVTININADNDAPTASAGSNQTVNEGDVVTLTAAASSDPEAQGLTYTWTQTAGPTVTLNDATAGQPTFTAPDGLANSTVIFELTVNDGVNSSSVDSVSININADNDAPTASAGSNQTVNEGDVVTLTAAASSDPEAQGLTYSWVQTKGPAVTLDDANAARPQFSAPEGLANSDFQFALTVSDGVNSSSIDSVTITVNAINDAPNASAGIDQITTEGDLVTLQGSGSSDAEGQVLTYSWLQTKGPTVLLSDANTSNPTFTAPEGLSNAQLQFQLTASDGTTASADTVDITINADNDAPISDAGAPQSIIINDIVQLDGSASSDVEGQALTYNWIQTSGPTVTLDDPTAVRPTFTAPGFVSNTDIEFDLLISDGTSSSSSTVSITVNTDNAAPTANAGRNTLIQEGNTFTLNGAASTDPEGQELTYTWRQISGPSIELDNPNEAQAQFTAPEFLSNTAVQFELSVSDGTNKSTDTITVGIAANDDAPSVSAGRDRVVLHNQEVQLQADATDPEGLGITYQWRQVGGPAVDLKDGTSNAPTFESPDAPDGAVLQFIVSADDGNSKSFDTVNIVIAPNAGPQVQIFGDNEVDAGGFATVGAGARDIEGDDLTFKWTQVSGPSVTLPADDQPQLRFQAPNVTDSQEVTFQVEVSDGHRTTTQFVTIMIQGDATDTVTTSAIGRKDLIEAVPEVVEAESKETQPEVIVQDYDFSKTSATTSPVTSGLNDDYDTGTTQAEPLTLGSLAAVNLDSSAAAMSASPSTLAAPSALETDSSIAASAAELAEESSIESMMAGNLLEESAAATDMIRTPLVSADLVVADAGDAVRLRAPMTALEASEAATAVRWRQVSGTPIEVTDDSSEVLLVSMPEVFAAEEVVFEVEIISGGQRVVQEVTVQVQPVGMTNRSLSIDEHLDNRQVSDDSEEDQGSRGLGKIWGAMLAFFGTQTGRKKN